MIAIISAPSNLGLRPPVPGAVPGTAKAPEALRQAGLYTALSQLGAIDAGVVLPGRYVDDDDASRAEGRVRNHDAIIDHARRLAARLAEVQATGRAPLVLGGDCSLIVAAGIASRARGGAGLVHIDGHTDFRQPGGDEPLRLLGPRAWGASITIFDPDLDPDGTHARTVSRIVVEGLAHLGEDTNI